MSDCIIKMEQSNYILTAAKICSVIELFTNESHLMYTVLFFTIHCVNHRSPTGLSVLSTDAAIKQLLRIVSSCMQHTTDNTFSLCSNVLANIMK